MLADVAKNAAYPDVRSEAAKYLTDRALAQKTIADLERSDI